MRFIKITEEDALPSTVDVGTELEDFYKELRCDMIECAIRCINGKTYSLIIDEIGKIKDRNPTVISLDSRGSVSDVIVGDILITNLTDQGETAPLTDEDILNILRPENFPLCSIEGKHKPLLAVTYF